MVKCQVPAQTGWVMGLLGSMVVSLFKSATT
jgi:hypothetical protein